MRQLKVGHMITAAETPRLDVVDVDAARVYRQRSPTYPAASTVSMEKRQQMPSDEAVTSPWLGKHTAIWRNRRRLGRVRRFRLWRFLWGDSSPNHPEKRPQARSGSRSLKAFGCRSGLRQDDVREVCSTDSKQKHRHAPTREQARILCHRVLGRVTTFVLTRRRPVRHSADTTGGL